MIVVLKTKDHSNQSIPELIPDLADVLKECKILPEDYAAQDNKSKNNKYKVKSENGILIQS